MPDQTKPAEPPRPETERKIDREVEDTFPASDPPAHSGVTGPKDTPKDASKVAPKVAPKNG